MTRLDLHDAQPEFAVERQPDGEVQVQVRAGGVDVRITIGSLYDDMSLLAASLHHLAEDVDEEILDGWQDTPDEFDGYISFDRGRYHVSLDGTRVGDYTSREVAEIELARAMVAGGVFPNAWFITDHGNTVAIDEDIRRWHDEGGDQMAPLPGMQYQPGQRSGTPTSTGPTASSATGVRPAWKSTPKAIRASGRTSPTAPSCDPTPTDPDRPHRGRFPGRPRLAFPAGGPPSGHPTGTAPRGGIHPRSAARRRRQGCGKEHRNGNQPNHNAVRGP